MNSSSFSSFFSIPMNGAHLSFHLHPSKIAFFKFILEGYDHLATLTVLDPQIALLKVSFYPTEEKTIREILADFEVSYIEGYV